MYANFLNKPLFWGVPTDQFCNLCSILTFSHGQFLQCWWKALHINFLWPPWGGGLILNSGRFVKGHPTYLEDSSKFLILKAAQLKDTYLIKFIRQFDFLWPPWGGGLILNSGRFVKGHPTYWEDSSKFLILKAAQLKDTYLIKFIRQFDSPFSNTCIACSNGLTPLPRVSRKYKNCPPPLCKFLDPPSDMVEYEPLSSREATKNSDLNVRYFWPALYSYYYMRNVPVNGSACELFPQQFTDLQTRALTIYQFVLGRVKLYTPVAVLQ